MVEQAGEDKGGLIKVELTTSRKKLYSRSEKQLFQLLPQDGRRITSTELTKRKTRRANSWTVNFPRNNVTVTMKHLIAKVRHNRETFVIHQSRRRGPHPVEYWIEVREPPLTVDGGTRS